jgi:hypothetical protein
VALSPQARPARKPDKLTATCEPTAENMGTLLVSNLQILTARSRDLHIRFAVLQIDHATPLYPQKLALNFDDKWRSLSRYSSLAD